MIDVMEEPETTRRKPSRTTVAVSAFFAICALAVVGVATAAVLPDDDSGTGFKRDDINLDANSDLGVRASLPRDAPAGTPTDAFLTSLPFTEDGGQQWTTEFSIDGEPSDPTSPYTFRVTQTSNWSDAAPPPCPRGQIERSLRDAELSICPLMPAALPDDIRRYWNSTTFVNDPDQLAWLDR